MMNVTFDYATSIDNKNIQIETGAKNDVIEYSPIRNGKASNIFALAKAFLSIESMTHKKLQKLCYYAKAWYLALYDSNLITEQFQAWVHGAVQPALYQKYKNYGYSDIPQFFHIQEIPEEFLSFAREVYAAYGHLTGDELEEINHNETPWIEARGNCRPWESCQNYISEESMKSYYRKMIV